MRIARITRTGPTLALAFAAVLGVGLGLAACDISGRDAGGDDAQATADVADAVDSTTELARLVVPLQATADLAPLSGPLATVRAIQDAIAAFRLLVDDRACLAITTDGAASLDVTFTGCRVAILFQLDGSLHAGLAIETDAGGAPVALVAQVSTPGLVLAGRLRTRTLSGAFALRHTIPPTAMPVEFSGRLGFVSSAGAALSLSADAAWQVASNCVTLDGGGQLTGGGLGPEALAGHGVQGCRDACATAGSVELSYASGTLLDWTYTGAPVAHVIGPRGKQLAVSLACAGS